MPPCSLWRKWRLWLSPPIALELSQVSSRRVEFTPFNESLPLTTLISLIPSFVGQVIQAGLHSTWTPTEEKVLQPVKNRFTYVQTSKLAVLSSNQPSPMIWRLCYKANCKKAKLMLVKMLHKSSIQLTIYVLKFLSTFKKIWDSKRLSEGALMWLFNFFIRNPTVLIINGGTGIR